jgi:tetratricopeptide (TPR) repeat protein
MYRVLPATGAAPSASLPPVRPLATRIDALLQPGRDPDLRRQAAQQLTALGRFYLARNDATRAAALFDAALAIRPGDVVATVDLAVVRARGGDVAGALTLVEAALAREPHRVIARVNAGRYRLQLGDLDGAAREFAAARADDPAIVSPLVGLARVAEARRDRATALAHLHAAQHLQRDDAEVRALAKELER